MNVKSHVVSSKYEGFILFCDKIIFNIKGRKVAHTHFGFTAKARQQLNHI